MTSEEGALLLCAHMKNPKHADILNTDLPQQIPFLSLAQPRAYPAEPLPGSKERSEGSWVFEDDNAATHLMRNTLGGAGWNREVRRQVLSMRGQGTRVMRDDITST